MNTERNYRKRLSMIFWAVLLIWWGMRWSVLISLPEGSGLLGTGLLLLAANILLKAAGLDPKPDNTFIGLIAFISGGALVIMSYTPQSANLPVFETILVAAGIVLLLFALTSKNKMDAEKS